MAKKYTVAFLFSDELRFVALIRKVKPEWQKGKLNGIGGKVEEGESFREANAREFQEETGVVTGPNDWSRFARIETVNTEIEFFTMKSDRLIDCVETQPAPVGQECEDIEVEDVADVCGAILEGNEKSVENLPWLIALAVDHLQDGRPTFALIKYDSDDTVKNATHERKIAGCGGSDPLDPA